MPCMLRIARSVPRLYGKLAMNTPARTLIQATALAFPLMGLASDEFWDEPLSKTAQAEAALRAVPPGAASSGHGRGHWRTYSALDGLPGVVLLIFQDREGGPLVWHSSGCQPL